MPVRKTCMQFVCRIVENMGPGRVLSGVKDTTDKLLPAVAGFLQDSSLETRSVTVTDINSTNGECWCCG